MTDHSTLIKNLNEGYEKSLFLKAMELKVLALGEDTAVLELACNEHTVSPYGSLYGGVVSFAADIAIWNALLTRDEKPAVATTDLNIHYLDRFTTGTARFEAKVLRYGSRMVIGETNIFNNQGVLAAHATASFLKVGK